MAKKDKGKQSELQLIDQVADSANEIWLAGLAAFEKAQREGGKVFSKLVKEGKKVESQTLEMAGSQLDDIKNRASGTWGKLETLFEERVQRAITSLGVPTGSDVRNLAKKVDSLSASVKTASPRKATVKGKTTSAAGKTTAPARTAASTRRAATSAKAVVPAKKVPASPAKKAASAKKAAGAPKAKKPAATPVKKAASGATPKPASSAPKARSSAAARAKPATAGPDDLKTIAGIGPALERKLKEHGVTTFAQIAAWTSKEVEEIESKVIRFSGRITREKWIAQAKAAHRKKQGG